MLPDSFARIEFWRISGKSLQMDLWRSTGNQKLFHVFGAINRSAIPDDQQPTTKVTEQMTQEENAFLAAQRMGAGQSRQPAVGCDSTHHRQVIACLKDLENWRLSTRRVCAHQTRQQVEPRLINTNNEASFAAGFFFKAGQTSLRHRMMAASSRCVARSSGRCGVHSSAFNNRETCALWYVTLNSHRMTLATRSQVQTAPRKPYFSAPALSKAGSCWSCSVVRRGLAPLRGLAMSPLSPCWSAIFIHLLTAVLLTERASATSSCVHPSRFSSKARKRRISRQSVRACFDAMHAFVSG